MQYIADLHIHSPYSRACSPLLSLENISKRCEEKGIDIISTGDFSHPIWFKNLKNNLIEIGNDNGLYIIKNNYYKVSFILGTELSLVYKDKDKVRRIHLVILAPNLDSAERLNNYLSRNFNIKYDGRPIIKMQADKLVNLCLKINPQFLIYPAHIWTPWYSILGSKSGFDNFKDCFKSELKNIYAYETGISSDPDMNSRVSLLNNLTSLSNSDAHSLETIGREANIFKLKNLNYKSIYKAIVNNNILASIESFSKLGLYYFDGHRKCNFSCRPEESRKLNNTCPVCDKPLTIGVLNRVEELTKNKTIKNANRKYFQSLSLRQLIAFSKNIKNINSQKVSLIYNKLIFEFKNEFNILLFQDLNKLSSFLDNKAIKLLKLSRENKLNIKPGYDGRPGEIVNL